VHSHDLPLEARLAGDRWAAGIRVPFGTASDRAEATGRRRSAGGLGDIRLSGLVTAWRDDAGAQLDLGLKLRLPTGDVRRGMGTGAAQVAPVLEASLPFGTAQTLDVTLERRINGGGAGTGLRDHWYATLDLGHALTPRVSVGASVVAREASVRGGGPVLEIGPTLDLRLEQGWTLGLIAYAGTTRDSAAFGAGLTLSRRFRF